MSKTENSKSELPEDYEVVIRPSKNWFSFDLRGLWSYRDMLRFLVIRDFIVKFKQTLLGPAWYVIQPLFTTLIFTIIFGRIAGISTDGLPQPLFYLAGQLGWFYFASCFMGASASLVGNAALFRKVFFPRMIMPLSVVASNLIAFTIQLITFLCFWAYFKNFTAAAPTFNFSPFLFLFPLLVLQTALIALGIGLLMAALSAKYRDLQKMSPFIIQSLMYITPIIYPISKIPENFHWLVNINPLAAVVESYRLLFLGSSAVSSADIIQSIVISVVLFAAGVIAYNRVQRNFVDYS